MRIKLKVLQIGDFRFSYYDDELYRSFKVNDNLNVTKFEWKRYFNNYIYDNLLKKIYYSFQNRYKVGPIVNQLNRDIVTHVKANKYDCIFIWRGVHLYPSTIRFLRSNSVVIGYNNDETYSKKQPWWLFSLLKRSIKYYDYYYSYRQSDVNELIKQGVDSSIFMPTYDVNRIYPISNRNQIYDVAFIGHYEDDGRDSFLIDLYEQGFKVLLRGQGWLKSKYAEKLNNIFGEIVPAYDDYNEVLNSTKVCLCLLSKKNNDKYTRRTVEIPAAKVTLLSEYTIEQSKLLEPNVDAVYFTSYSDAINKLKTLLSDDEYRNYLSLSGYLKVTNGNFSISSRVDDILRVYNNKSALKVKL